jgi:citrate lyase beta subunit
MSGNRATAVGKSAYRSIRSILETPILDERKWAKVPDIPADMIFLDLEDSVTPARKEKARERAVHYLRDPSYFAGRPTLARPNHLTTPWGREDVIAFAESGVTCIAYPKVGSIDELVEVVELLAAHGATPDIYAIVESAGSMMDLRALAEHPQVVSLMFGPGDLSVEMNVPLLEPDGALNRVFVPMKSSVVLAATAARIGCTDIVYAPDYRDLDEVRRRARASRRLGFTALATFYPPHVQIIHEIFTPTDAEVTAARQLVHTYEAVLAEGRPAALGADGATILVHDYEKALSVLAKAR